MLTLVPFEPPQLSNHTTGSPTVHGPVRHWYQHLDHSEGKTMAKRGRKKRDRKHSKANHGNRPNA